MNRIYHSFIAFLVFIIACGDNTTTGNPMSLSVQGTKPGSLSASTFAKGVNTLASSGAINLVDSSGSSVGSVNLTDARIVLKEVEFEFENDGENDAEIEFAGPFVADLLTNTVTPSLDNILLDTGTYEEIFLSLDKIEGDEIDDDGNQLIPSTDPLFGHSLYIEGTYTGPSSSGAQTSIPFKMSFDLEEEFELTGTNDTSEGLEIDSATLNDVIVAFRLAKWFRFDNLETNGSSFDPSQFVVSGGEIDIDEDSTGANASLREVIKENILESADYGEDLDDDGELDIDEDDDPDSEDGDDD